MHAPFRRLTVSILALAITSSSVIATSRADLVVSPPSLSAELLTGQSADRVLTLTNSGASAISYALRIASADAVAVRNLRRSRLRGLAAVPQGAPRGIAQSPEQPRALKPWHTGQPALRPRLAPAAKSGAVLASDLRVLILTSGAGVIEIQAVLAALPDIGQVDVFDGQVATPSLAELATYDVVLVVINSALADPVATGDALADYVDAGGSVMLTLASFVSGWDVGGRFMAGGYHPLSATGGPIGSATLGAFDPTHPIMAGVSAATGALIADATLAPGAELVASWDNGEPFVATRERSVVALNLYVADAGFWTGDIPILLRNAMLWSANAVTWLSASPDSGVVAPGGQATANVRFDAAGLPGGAYDAVVVVAPLDPAVPEIPVPAHLEVTGAPDLLLEGSLNLSESAIDFTFDGATTSHALDAVIVPGGDGTLEVIADGDFGNSFETATVVLEGGFLGTLGASGNDCTAASSRFVLAAADLAGWVADQVVQVTVQNSFDVNPFCVVNRHTVRLSYRGPSDSLDFATGLVGACESLSVALSNRGSEPLTVEITSDRPEFSAPAFHELQPGESREVQIFFCPTAIGVVTGTMTLATNDPDQPQLTIELRGEGVVPPDIEVSPDALSADLLTGATAVRTLTVRNTGGEALAFEIDVESVAETTATRAPAPPPRGKSLATSADRAPRGWAPQKAARLEGSAQVLLIQDTAPWSSISNELVLQANGIPYASIPTGSIATTNLSAYSLVIVAGDQSTTTYATIASRQQQLAAYVAGGGVLDFHAAGWGWANGDASIVTLPGGMHVQQYHAWNFNDVLMPDHPIMAGVPDPFTGTPTSHGIFTSIPTGADLLANDDQGRPTLVVYPHGRGTVIASTQPMEYGYVAGQHTGLILANLIPYAFGLAPAWLDAQPRSGSVPPGGEAEVLVTFDATGLNGGDYEGRLIVASNDPDEGEILVPADLHVTGAPDLSIEPRPIVVTSEIDFTTSGATTMHHLPTPSAPEGDGQIELGIAGDFPDSAEFAVLAVEGTQLFSIGPVPTPCGTTVGGIGVDMATLAAWIADGVVDAEVHNSSGVDPICQVNRHTVRLIYTGAVTAIDLGTRFVGACHGETLRVANAGTDVLDVQLTSNRPEFVVDPSAFSLAPGDETPVVVTFCPPTVDVFDGTLTLQTNDPDESEVAIALHGQGVPPPEIEVSPASLSADLFTGQAEVRTLTVRNTGGSDLVFAAGVENPPILPQAEVRLAKGEADTRRGPPVIHGRGGPDAFGYRWVDSDEPGGPTFDWVEIAGVGTALPFSGDDWNSGPVPIGFEFPYYDQRFSTVNVCSNGWISFTSFSAQFGTVPLPSPFAPENLLAAFWGDLYTDSGEVLYHHDGTRLIVEYRNVSFLGSSIPLTFQIQLYPTGRIVYQYLDLGGIQPFATVGFQNATQSDGLTIAFQTQYLHPGLAIEIAARPSWLSVTPANGVIPAGGSIDLQARFDASGLFGGTYDGMIAITSNDPDEAITQVPAQLHVTGAPDLQLGSVAIEIESSADFTGSGAVTHHTLLTPAAPEDGGLITFGIEGDISDSTDVAVLSFDGVLVAALGGAFPPCAPFTGFFGIGQTDLLAFTADGVIQAEVRNSPSLDATCPINRHTIKLRYRGPATALNFGSTFVGGCQAESLRVANVGTDVLNVNFVTSASEFTVAPPALSLPPGGEAAVMVNFCPSAVASFDGTLTLQSNDPDEPKVVLALHGVGVPPPDVEVSPTALSADLLTGQTATRTVTIRNTGGSTLDFSADPERAIGDVVGRAPLPTELMARLLTPSRSFASRTGDPAVLRTDRAPEGHRATAPSRIGGSAPVLLIQDVLPWGTFANENVLQNNGIAYVSLPTSAIASTDLSAYRLVIVASDQFTSSYLTLAGLQGQLTAYVEQGGVLEFHAAGWGWQGGDASVVTIPGGMSINLYFSSLNHLLDPSHPILRGVPDPFGGPSSHAYFGEVPTGSRLLAGDDFGRPTLVTYRLGEGEVIATTQTVEYLYGYGYPAGQILANMIPFSFRMGPPWLSAFPRSGSVPPGGAVDVTVGIDAAGLAGGDYQALLVVRTNDPDESETPVSVALHVTGAPDLVLPGPQVNQISAIDFFTSGATTRHDIAVPAPSEGPGVVALMAEGDFDSAGVATVIVEGTQLGEVGGFFPCGQFFGAFFASAANLAAWTADGVVQAEVRNSAAVDPFCFVNRHTVQLVYQSRVTRLDFGSIFAGQCRADSMNVANNGTEDLQVAFASSRPEFVAPPPLVLPPGGGQTVMVSFCPTTPGIFDGTLTLTTNDPDESEVVIALHGVGVPPPDVEVSPTSLSADLLTGQIATRTVSIHNTGGSPLVFTVDLERAVGDLAAWAPLPPELAARRLTAFGLLASRTGDPAVLRSDRAPQGYTATAPSRITGSAPVLLIQDASPWGSFANESVLQTNGIAYVTLPTSAIASTDLSAYRLVIVASDQPTTSYLTLAGLQTQLTAYVEQGGVLEFHAAGWGWQGGDASVVTVPGGMNINLYYSSMNDVLDPSHPIMAGVPDPFFGSSASHAYFGNVPTDARLLAADDQGRPTLVAYRLGEGEVIAATQILEYAYWYGQSAGQILANMIPFSFRKGPPWLSAFPRSGSVPPGGIVDVSVGLDASGLVGGDYQARLVVRSNDPDEPETPVSVALHVTGSPDLSLPGPQVNQFSGIDFATSGATTLHDIAVPTPSEGPGVIVLLAEGDFDSAAVATLTVEGTVLGEVGGFFACGQFGGAFFTSAALMATWTADGVVHAEVRNSPQVDPFCFVNRHTVQVVYQGRTTELQFGSLFAGGCRPESLNVANTGSEELQVTFTSSRPEFVAPPPLVLPPGGGATVMVSFCPTTPGIFDGTLTLTTNDPDEPVVTIALHGEALAAPDIAVGSTRVTADLLPGETGSKTLRIANHGEGTLFAHLGLRIAGAPVASRPAVVAQAPPPAGTSAEHLALRSRYGAPSARVTAPTTIQRPAAATWAATPAPPRTQAYSIFFDDMEHGIGGWTHRSTAGDSVSSVDLWAQSHNRSSSGVTSWRVMQHDFQGADALESPPIDLNGLTEATLTFMHWYQFDDCSGTADFEPDGGIVEVSTDGGASWMQIQPRSGYPYVLDDICGNPLAFRLAYAHQNGLGAFQPDTFDLSGFTGQIIRLRFHAGWDCGNCLINEGWYIDDVSVFAPSAPWVSVSPQDLIVAPLDEGEATLTFDATLVPPGVYDALLDISSNDPDEPLVTVPINLVVADVGATVQVLPETINLHPLLKALTANIESPPGHGPGDVVRDLVRFNRDAAPDPNFGQIVDADHNGIPELRLKFFRSVAVPTLAEGDPTPVVITGEYSDGLRFLARDELRVVRARFASPDPGQWVVPGTPFVIEWTVPEGWSPSGTDVFWSRDDGVTWQPIAMGVTGARATWTPPEIVASAARVRIAVHDPDGLIAISTSGAFRIARTATAIEQLVALGGRQLLQNAPNPFRAGSATSIAFRLPAGSRANLRVYDLAGHLVRVLVDGWLPAGDHLARWDGRDRDGRAVGSGIYFYRLDAGGWRESRRMTLLR